MSQQITTSFVTQFSSAIDLLVAQRTSKLRPYVNIERVVGKDAYLEQIGNVAATQRTSRHSDSPMTDTPHDRRKLTISDYEIGDMIDNADRLKTLIDPSNVYTMRFAEALGRTMDDVIIASAIGTAYSGVAGGTSNSLAAANTVAYDYQEDGTTGTGKNLTIGKLRKAKYILDNYDVPGDDRFIAIGPLQLQSLLATTTVTSGDYNTVKALVQGELDTYLGFKFINLTRLTTASANVRACFAWHRSGVTLGLQQDVQTRIAERPDKSFGWYAHASMSIGAVRMEEKRVVQINCSENVALGG